MKFRRRHRRYHRRRFGGIKLKKQTVYTIGAIWLWLFAAIVTLSFFGESVLLNRIREELFYQFGWGMFLLPPFLVSLSFLFFKVKSSLGKPNVPMGFAVSFTAIIVLTRAGLVGETLFAFLESAIAVEGAIIASLLTLLTGLILLFNATLEQVVNLLLLGWETVIGFFGNLAKRLAAKKEKPPAVSKTISREEEQLLSKAPVTPPPIPAKRAEQRDEMSIMPSVSAAADATAWEYPPLTLLSDGPAERADRGDTKRNTGIIEKTLESFGIQSKVVEVNSGPAVTQYAIRIALGTKVSRITALSSDLALALAAPTGQVRIEAPFLAVTSWGSRFPIEVWNSLPSSGCSPRRS